LLVGLFAGLGCAPGRLADLQDSGRLAVGIGLGLSADVQVGALTHPALGVVSSSAMIGFESRGIEGPWYEARISDPYAVPWYRREGKSWTYALNSSGWRGVWESLDWLDALTEVDEPVDQEGLPETGTAVGGELLDGKVLINRWLPIRGDPSEPPAWTFNTATDVHAGATLLLVSGRLGFNALEFVDLLGGLAGFDLAGDDPPAD
jgi:hypothetical protein